MGVFSSVDPTLFACLTMLSILGMLFLPLCLLGARYRPGPVENKRSSEVIKCVWARVTREGAVHWRQSGIDGVHIVSFEAHFVDVRKVLKPSPAEVNGEPA